MQMTQLKKRLLQVKKQLLIINTNYLWTTRNSTKFAEISNNSKPPTSTNSHTLMLGRELAEIEGRSVTVIVVPAVDVLVSGRRSSDVATQIRAGGEGPAGAQKITR